MRDCACPFEVLFLLFIQFRCTIFSVMHIGLGLVQLSSNINDVVELLHGCLVASSHFGLGLENLCCFQYCEIGIFG